MDSTHRIPHRHLHLLNRPTQSSGSKPASSLTIRADRGDCPSCCSLSATTGNNAGPPAGSTKRASPGPKTLDEFDFAANTTINPATINTLAGCGWVSKGQSLCLIGDSGTGKSHLLIGLGTAAAQAGHKVRYVLAAKLVNELVEAADERQLSRTIARYGRVELLCLDELGYMGLDKRGAELLFQVLTEREKKTAVAIASNDSFSGWTKTFTDPRLCAAIVDRLTFGGNIIETGTSSYRLAHARTQRTRNA